MLPKIIIGVLVFATIFVPTILLIVNLVEKARIKRDRKIAKLTYTFLSLNAMVNGIPPQYRIYELTCKVLKEAIEALIHLKEIRPKDRSVLKTLQVQKEKYRELLQQKDEKPAHYALESVQVAQRVQHYQVKLIDYVQVRKRNGTLSSIESDHYTTELQWLATKCVCDVFLEKAKKFAETENYRLALLNINKAVQLYEKLPHLEKCKQAIDDCRKKAKALETEQEAYNERRKAELEEERSNVKNFFDEAWEADFEGDTNKKKYY